MLHVRGTAGGTELTGELYERGEQAPSFRGAPDEGAPYTWVCDEFFQVESGGLVQQVGDERIHVVFERPTPRGFDSRDEALRAATEHVRTQFARIGIERGDVEVEITDEDRNAIDTLDR